MMFDVLSFLGGVLLSALVVGFVCMILLSISNY